MKRWSFYWSKLLISITDRRWLCTCNLATTTGTWWCHAMEHTMASHMHQYTVYPKKYAHGFVVLCFVVVLQSFIMNSHEVFIHIHQGCFAGTGAIIRLPQCQWSKPDGYGKISQYITTTKHSKAKSVCIFLGIYCINQHYCRIVCYDIFVHQWRQPWTGFCQQHFLQKYP